MASERSRQQHGINKRRLIGILLLVVLGVIIVILGAVAGYALYKWKNGDQLDRQTMFAVADVPEADLTRVDDPESSQTETMQIDGKTAIQHNGKYYVLNENIFSILFMGIDTTNEKQYQNIGTNSNQSDSLILAVVDPDQNDLTMINIPRNSVTDVKQLDVNFNYARTTKSPICIQHAFGDGAGLSCDLTREAASNLLFNIPIHRYISVNLDGLFIANDAIGGVTVELLDDMTAFNPKMEKGKTYKLDKKDAEIYVARRLGEGLDGTNMSRVKRQVQYYKAFFSLAKQRLQDDPLFAINLYNSMKDSVHTDMSMDEMVYLSKKVIDMDMNDDNVHTLTGTADEESDDFFVDDQALKDLLIQVFYVEAEQ